MKSLLMSFAFAMVVSAVSAQNAKSAFIHMKSGEIKEIPCMDVDSITFADHVDYDKVFEAKYASGIYGGEGKYMVHLSDAPISSTGTPTKAGQTIVRFMAYNDNDADPKNAVLPEGTYVANESRAPWSLFASARQLCAIYCTEITDEGPDGYTIPFVTATASLKYSGGKYYIDFKGDAQQQYEGVDFKTVHVTYNGELKFDNQDPMSYDKLADDVTFVPTQLSGRYTVSTRNNCGNYSIALFNCPLDGSGFVVGAGELVNLELFTKASASMDINDLSGEYTITSASAGPYVPGRFISGMIYKSNSMYYPVGTYYETFLENGESSNMYGFATGGKVKVSTDGTNVAFDCDIETESGKHVRINSTLTASGIEDYSGGSSSAPAQHNLIQKDKDTFAPLFRFDRVNVYDGIPALKLLKNK